MEGKVESVGELYDVLLLLMKYPSNKRFQNNMWDHLSMYFIAWRYNDQVTLSYAKLAVLCYFKTVFVEKR